MQYLILQILTPHLLLCDFAVKSYNHFNGEGSDFKSCSSPYTKNSALISGCVQAVTIKTVQLHLCFSVKNKRGHGISVICNKISGIQANRRTSVCFVITLGSNAIPNLLKRQENVLDYFCPIPACQVCTGVKNIHAYWAINFKETQQQVYCVCVFDQHKSL